MQVGLYTWNPYAHEQQALTAARPQNGWELGAAKRAGTTRPHRIVPPPQDGGEPKRGQLPNLASVILNNSGLHLPNLEINHSGDTK